MTRYLITAGPTREPIDAVRYIGNRSSGKMGLALAQAAVEAGHRVTLLLGPGPPSEAAPSAARIYRFNASTELKQLLEAHWDDHDVLIMAAAVADYRPETVVEGKLPRNPDGTLTLTLRPTPDLVALMADRKRPHQCVIAFALEMAEQLEQRAAAKLRAKKVDAIVANPLGTMEADAITATWITAAGQVEPLPRMSKEACAQALIERIEALRESEG